MVATPEQVMKLYINKLTPYEHHEIFNYPQIYFIGANAKKRPGIIGGPNNCGYDDEQVRKEKEPQQLILRRGCNFLLTLDTRAMNPKRKSRPDI